MKAMKLLYRISNGMVYAISFVILAILTIKNLIFSTYVMNIKEHQHPQYKCMDDSSFYDRAGSLFYLLFKFSKESMRKTVFIFFS